MAKEIEPIQQIEQRRDRVSQVLGERESLVDRIGTGAVKVGSSWENTLKVGRVRSKVRASVNRLRGELGQLDEELDAYGQARDYLGQITLRQTQLAEMSEMVAEGNLPQDVLQTYQQQYEELTSLPERNPALGRGLERIRLEEEARKSGTETAPSHSVFETPRSAEPERQRVVEPESLILPVQETDTLLVPDQGKRGSERFRLPTGEEVGGKVGELLRLIAESSPDSLSMSDILAQELYPGVDNAIARQRLSVLMTQARKKLSGTGLDLVNVTPQSERLRGQKGGYYLRHLEATQSIESAQPEQHTGFKFEDEEQAITGEVAKLLQKLSPLDPHHVVTYQELLKEVGSDDPQILHQHLEEVRKLANTRKLRLAYVPNPRDSRNIGYYVETIRRPKVKITLLGDVVEHGKRRIKLSEEQYRLMWSLAAHREDPTFDTDLSERAFNEPNPEASPLNEVATALNEQLIELTGAEGIVISGGDEQFGLWHKIKDARIVRKPGFLPVHSTRLDALHLIFQDASKQDIIRTLGVTRGRKRASHGLTDPQALVALSRAVTRLTNRANEDITNEPETDTYLEMSDYMTSHNLEDPKALIAYIAQRLGVSYNPASLQENAQVVDDATELKTQEAHYVDEGIAPANAPEFANLSRADITMIVAAINMHRSILEPILDRSGVKLIEQSMLTELVELRGDEPIADFSKIRKEERDQFVYQFRIQALEKVRELIESPDFDQIAEQIYTQNPNVWCLLVNLSEMNKVKVMNGLVLSKE